MRTAVVFSPLVTVNNLGRRRFIAPLSKCFRRIRVLWPSYWSNWEDVQQSKRNSWELHRMHGIRMVSGPFFTYCRPFKLFSLACWWKQTYFLPIFFHVREPRYHSSMQVGINLRDLNSKSVYVAWNGCSIFGINQPSLSVNAHFWLQWRSEVPLLYLPRITDAMGWFYFSTTTLMSV